MVTSARLLHIHIYWIVYLLLIIHTFDTSIQLIIELSLDMKKLQFVLIKHCF
jgi:hypothetical protein